MEEITSNPTTGCDQCYAFALVERLIRPGAPGGPQRWPRPYEVRIPETALALPLGRHRSRVLEDT